MGNYQNPSLDKVTVSKLVEGCIKKDNRNELRSFRNPKERRIRNMRLKLILPIIDPEQFIEPAHCIDPKCKGDRFRAMAGSEKERAGYRI